MSRNDLSKNPVIILIGFLASCLTIIVSCLAIINFLTDFTNIPSILPASKTPTFPSITSTSVHTPIPKQVNTPILTIVTENNVDAVITFTDQKKYYSIDIPGDWNYSQTVDSENNYYYIDTFSSPDQMALVENIVYDDGKPFSGTDKGKFALYLLNTFYSKTGKEGDIQVSNDRMMEDGSERLTWTSKAGGYSGISFLETRGTDTFLLFTVEWVNSAEDQYKSTLDDVIGSYRVP